jgi:hypothetical protein
MALLPKDVAGGRCCSGTDLLGAFFGSDHEVWEEFRRLESETYVVFYEAFPSRDALHPELSWPTTARF